VSTTMPVATDHASASTSVTFGSVRSVGGTFPVILVHTVASSLRSRNTPPVVAIVVTSRVLEPPPFFSLFLPIRILLAPFSNTPSSAGPPVPRLVAVTLGTVRRARVLDRGRELLRMPRRHQPIGRAPRRVRESDADGPLQVRAQQDVSRRVGLRPAQRRRLPL